MWLLSRCTGSQVSVADDSEGEEGEARVGGPKGSSAAQPGGRGQTMFQQRSLRSLPEYEGMQGIHVNPRLECSA